MSDLDAVAEAGCVFCPPNWPNLDIVERSGVCAIVRPLNPVTDGHVLVIDREHTAHAAATPRATRVAGQTMRFAADYVARHGLSANIITSIGEAATQSVFHTHLHVVPRRPGDGLALPWTGQQERDARTITTVEQLDALPVSTVVRDGKGWLWEVGSDGVYSASFATPSCIDKVALPALVLWLPEAVDRG